MAQQKKEQVYLRKRLMPSGNISLYLDTFTRDGRVYEYLKLYLIPEHSRADKGFRLWHPAIPRNQA